jgi:NDP-sugar pyrophosphorylase family protein
MTTRWRALSAEEIGRLSQQGCTCTDWSKVQVAEDFRTQRVRATHFAGDVRLGVFDKEASFFGGVTKPTGISHATIHNCTIGDNVYISTVRNYVANYVIADDAIIDNIDLLAVQGESAFGNGTKIAVVNEAGGREVPMYDHLSAQTAYVLAFYQHRPKVIQNLRALIDGYTASVRSRMGTVGKGARIINSRLLKDIRVGPAATVEGVNRLENGSINSCFEDPVYIGPGVYAEDFIACSGSTISDGAIVSHCFVGQGCVLSKQYSAENSVFFANCGGFHGEACSIFAGPYTVTHHKSTLLIAGLFSFLNAGSGTNQSNHMYKLGPVHQGVVERGSKTGSDSYMLWPAKVGAFTVVMGRHYRNSDTSDLPFSYLIEHEDESVLAPGVNLRSVGTVRDARKWPKRDRRKDPRKLDHINFKLLSPYTIQKMINGRDLLHKLKATTGHTSDYFIYHNVKIPSHSLDRGIELYQIGIDKFLGNCLITRLAKRKFQNVGELQAVLRPETPIGPGKWIDLGGMFAPEEVVQQFLSDIESGAIHSLDEVDARFAAMHENYPRYEWSWAVEVLQKELNKTLDQITVADVVALTHRWKKAVLDLDQLLYEDTKKEFAATAQTGFGLDGDENTKHSDFAAVRGTFEADGFVGEIRKHMDAKTALANELLSRIEPLQKAG